MFIATNIILQNNPTTRISCHSAGWSLMSTVKKNYESKNCLLSLFSPPPFLNISSKNHTVTNMFHLAPIFTMLLSTRYEKKGYRISSTTIIENWKLKKTQFLRLLWELQDMNILQRCDFLTLYLFFIFQIFRIIYHVKQFISTQKVYRFLTHTVEPAWPITLTPLCCNWELYVFFLK